MKLAPLVFALIASRSAFAHEGHGLSGWHWHASDTFGFVLVAALAALAAWIARDR